MTEAEIKVGVSAEAIREDTGETFFDPAAFAILERDEFLAGLRR